jgi:dTDP-4-dehydrorhamnose reductase
MNIIIFGKDGQLGKAFKDICKTKQVERQHRICYAGRAECDLANPDAITALLNKIKPDLIVNAAAYTAVDQAETEVDLAYAINAKAPEIMAKYAKGYGATFLHYSTDYVFDGIASVPYVETDFTNPLGVYGLTKCEGEEALMLSGCDGYVFRTSWLYSVHGHNFLKTILRLGAERETLNMVYDQVGTPTLADDLVKAIFTLIAALDNKQKVPTGIYHFSNEGVTSWYDFAQAIVELAGLKCKIMPILTKEYPTASARPAYSLLNKGKVKAALGIEIPHWRASLKQAVSKLL